MVCVYLYTHTVFIYSFSTHKTHQLRKKERIRKKTEKQIRFSFYNALYTKPILAKSIYIKQTWFIYDFLTWIKATTEKEQNKKSKSKSKTNEIQLLLLFVWFLWYYFIFGTFNFAVEEIFIQLTCTTNEDEEKNTVPKSIFDVMILALFYNFELGKLLLIIVCMEKNEKRNHHNHQPSIFYVSNI